jgi:tetratricopeptide (TPR) repeat protein
VCSRSEFFGRDKIIDSILAYVANGTSCSIVGERRIGKTSLLLHISHPSSRRRVESRPGLGPLLIVYLDFQGYRDLTVGTFWRALVEQAIHQAGGEDSCPEALPLLAELQQVSDLDVHHLRRFAGRLAQREIRLLLLLDEFEYVVDSNDLDLPFFAGLRSLVATDLPVTCITASRQHLSQIDRFASGYSISSSPFWNVFTTVPLNVFDDREAKLMLEEPLQGTGVSFSRQDVRFLHDLSGYHPFFLQMAAHFLFQEIVQRPQVAAEEKRQSARTVFADQCSPHFEFYWEKSSPVERSVLADYAREYPLEPEHLPDALRAKQAAVKSLLDRALLVPARNGGGLRLLSVSLADWIRQASSDRAGPSRTASLTRELLKSMSLQQFEILVRQLVEAEGYRLLSDLGGKPDIGFDILAERVTGVPVASGSEKVVIECKHYIRSGKVVGSLDIDAWQARMIEHGATGYLLVTSSRVTESLARRLREFTQNSSPRWAAWWDIDELTKHLEEQSAIEDALLGREPTTQVRSVHQIPEPPANFRGRQEELEELTAAIQGSGVTTASIRGLGGIGKTALALKLAHELAPDYPDAQIFIDLRGTTSPLAPTDVMGHVIHTFHPQTQLPVAESERSALYRSVLHGKKALLLLDDAADGDQVKPVLPPGSCALLVTSRNRFRLPGMHALDLDVLLADQARDLLCSIAPRIGDSAAEIAELCGFVPLALELAASALAEREDLAPADYVRRLQDERRRLDLVDASHSLTYDLLDQRLQRLLARLSVFSIPFERGAAAAVWEMDLDAALDSLGDLLRYSMIDWRENVERYDLYGLARLFAYRKLEEIEDPRPVHRLAAMYLHAKLNEDGGMPEEALEEVDQWEQAEVWDQFAREASMLVTSLDRLGYLDEIQERLERALRAAEDHLDEPQVEAMLMSGLGTIAYKRAEWDQAIDMYQRSLRAFHRVDDLRGIAQAWGNLGLVHADKGLWDQATEMYQQSLEGFEHLGDVYGVAQTLNNLGLVQAAMGRWDQAVEVYQQSIDTYERLGDMQGLAQTRSNLSRVYCRKGKWDEAIKGYRQCLEAYERIGDRYGLAQTCANLGRVYADRGEWDRSIALYEQALKTFGHLGDARSMARTWGNLGIVYRRKGEWDRAIEMYQRSLETKKRLGDLHGIAQTWGNLGLAYADKGEQDRAIEMYEQGLQAFERLGDVHGMAKMWGNLGLAYADEGEWDQAIEMYEHGLKAFERLGDVHGMAQTWGNLGLVYAYKGEWDRGIEMYQKTLDTYERLGDIPGMAYIWGNLGYLFHARNDTEQAARYAARAYVTFDMLEAAPEAHQAWRLLAEILGSVEAANAYLDEVSEDADRWDELSE